MRYYFYNKNEIINMILKFIDILNFREFLNLNLKYLTSK